MLDSFNEHRINVLLQKKLPKSVKALRIFLHGELEWSFNKKRPPSRSF